MTLIPPLERELVDAAKRNADGQQRPRSGRLQTVARTIPALAAVLVVIIVAGGAVVILGAHKDGPAGQVQRTHEGHSGLSRSHRAHQRPYAATAVHVEVVHADRYCTSRHGDLIERCPSNPHGLVRLGGAHSQWLVLFTITAPISVDNPDYYYHTADAPPGCPNASQFGEYDEPVHRGQSVTQYAAFAKGCPGLGHGTISIVAPRHGEDWPGAGTSRHVASFRFTIPPNP